KKYSRGAALESPNHKPESRTDETDGTDLTDVIGSNFIPNWSVRSVLSDLCVRGVGVFVLGFPLRVLRALRVKKDFGFCHKEPPIDESEKHDLPLVRQRRA